MFYLWNGVTVIFILLKHYRHKKEKKKDKDKERSRDERERSTSKKKKSKDKEKDRERKSESDKDVKVCFKNLFIYHLYCSINLKPSGALKANCNFYFFYLGEAGHKGLR